jgi:hypothetical protein
VIKVTPANPRLDSGSSFEDFDEDSLDDNHLQVPDGGDDDDDSEDDMDGEDLIQRRDFSRFSED